MILGQRVVVVLPAYEAAATLPGVLAGLAPQTCVDAVILVDDASPDATVAVARALGLDPIVHPVNRGYGGNQKTCYAAALAQGADVVVMLHPDGQYPPALVTALASMVASGCYDVVLGSRITGQPVRGGMPRYKYVANRVLTAVENALLGLKLSEYHSGYRAFSARLLRRLPLETLSDDFVFDNQIIAQAVAAGARLGEVSCPTHYGPESHSIRFAPAVRYGFGVLATAVGYRFRPRRRPSVPPDPRRAEPADDRVAPPPDSVATPPV